MIPFNRPDYGDLELSLLREAVTNGQTAGNGPFGREAESTLSEIHWGSPALLVTSCTHALELAARLLDLGPGDEVIVPAFTFVSSANAFLRNGARVAFADVNPDTLNADPQSVARLVSSRTRAICIVHYGGVAAEPDIFVDMAKEAGVTLIEDNAHGLGATWNGRPLGTFGAMSALSFHETKNISCGEGGGLILNDRGLVERAEILREKGTDRSKFLRGQVDKYTWVDDGSSWVLSDLLAAILTGQLRRLEEIQAARLGIWRAYREGLAEWAVSNGVRLPFIPEGADHSGHLFHLRFDSSIRRDAFLAHMRSHGVLAVFHYQSLDRSPMGRVFRSDEGCAVAWDASQTLARLPLYATLSGSDVERVIDAVLAFSG